MMAEANTAALSPDLSIVKVEVQTDYSEEQSPSQELVIKQELVIEELDLLQHPRVRAVFAVGGKEELSFGEIDTTKNNSDKIRADDVKIEGIRIKTEAMLDEQIFSSKLVLTDCAKELNLSRRFCSQCNILFSSCIALDNHLNVPCLKKKYYKCNLCQHRCTDISNFNTHMRIHSGVKRYKCNQCEYRCTKSSNLKGHYLAVHAIEKPIKCDSCDYRCTSAGILKVHKRKHTKEKPFGCNLCEYRCARNCDLKVHIRTHTQEKRFRCNLCDYKCTRNSFLVDHMRKHTNEIAPKPFKCNFCDYTCKRPSHLKVHTQRKHNNEIPNVS